MEKNSTAVQFGKRVKALRKQMGWSQEELAERANVHRTYVGMIERAEKNITLANIEKVARALGKNVMSLFED
jgi:transcriptional regulator with XRE-family HTH domain